MHLKKKSSAKIKQFVTVVELLRNMFSITLMENINVLILWADQALLSESYAFLKGHNH